MRWAIEREFGWNEVHQFASFTEWFNPDDVRIIISHGSDVGWIQQHENADAIELGSIYIVPSMQRNGIGTKVIQGLLDRGKERQLPVTLAVMKINPSRALYERLGFRVTHEDDHKLYMRADPFSV
jgi:GNAT superfamily N-acetyltransferase